MQFGNRTPYPGLVTTGVIDLPSNRMFGACVVRATYRWDGAALRLAGAAEQRWRVSPGPWESPVGPMPGDELFYRGGVDVLVFGHARPPGSAPAPRVDVTVAVGPAFRWAVAVFGERLWHRRWTGRLEATPPEPFTAQPLTLALAYGGRDVWDELEVPFPDNPDGRGYYLEARSAADRPLPAIEHPDRLVASWKDQPEPVGVGVAPLGFGPRLRRTLDFSPAGALQRLGPEFFNAAFPDMVAPRTTAAGDTVAVAGVSPSGPIGFTLPPPPVRVLLAIGAERQVLPPTLDQIGLLPEVGEVFLTWRLPFRFVLKPRETRVCEVLPAG